VEEWLKGMRMEKYWDLFQKNGFDLFAAVAEMNNDHLIEIGVDALGHRVVLLKRISELPHN
jgi:hypothetical protein